MNKFEQESFLKLSEEKKERSILIAYNNATKEYNIRNDNISRFLTEIKNKVSNNINTYNLSK
jgi:hypothetical protein